MNRVVFDASAVAALILGEPGSAPVEKARTGALITTVNACEVIETLLRRGDALDEAIEALRDLQLDPVPFTLDLAAVAAAVIVLAWNLIVAGCEAGWGWIQGLPDAG